MNVLVNEQIHHCENQINKCISEWTNKSIWEIINEWMHEWVKEQTNQC